MLKFINNLATIEINKEVNAIQLTFRNTDSLNQYSETMGMAMGFAEVHHISSYLLIKEQYSDISSTQFYQLVKHWLSALDERTAGNAGNIKVAMLTSPEAYDDIARCLQLTPHLPPYAHLSFTCCTDYASANRFFNTEIVHEEKYIAKV